MAGVAIVVAARFIGRPRAIDLRESTDAVPADVQVASLERSLARAALEVAGITDAEVRIRPARHHATITVRTVDDERDKVRRRIHDAVDARLGPLGLARRLPVHVTVAGKDGR